MDKIEKIRQYIESLYDGEVPKHDQQCDFGDGYFTGLSVISNFLDTLSEEPDKSLEQEIATWIPAHISIGTDETLPINPTEIANACKEWGKCVARHFAEWQKEQDLAEMAQSKSPLSVAYANRCFENGKQAMKEQMLKDAVETTVMATKCGDKYQQLLITDWNSSDGLHNGDKVRIVVLKEEEE